MRFQQVIFASLFVSSISGFSQATEPDLTTKIKSNDSYNESLFESAWESPSINNFARDYSITTINTSFNSSNGDEAIKMMEGEKTNYGAFDAKTYIKYKNSKLWGEAYYNNGNTSGIKWSAISDVNLIYPYILGGDNVVKRNLERYYFSGGYGNYNGRLAWGVSIGYKAGQYYQKVDPRPKNITSDFKMAGGVAYRLTKTNVIGADIFYNKYKQTSDVDFYSEFGQDKLYHFTGLGSVYTRFSGTGYSTFYDGNKWGISLTYYPVTGKGFMARVRADRFTFENLIEDLNHLPMASVKHNSISAMTGYRQDKYGIVADLNINRRNGTENIFGDAASQVYPQIGSVTMYKNNTYNMHLSGVYEDKLNTGNLQYSIKGMVGYAHDYEGYGFPLKEKLLNNVEAGIYLKGISVVRKKIILECNAGYELYKPIKSSFSILSDENPLNESYIHDFTIAQSVSNHVNVGAKIGYTINKDYAIGASIDWKHGMYVSNIDTNKLSVKLDFIF